MKAKLLGLVFCLVASFFTVRIQICLGAEAPVYLWQIGTSDRDDHEFALAPGGYGQFREDGFYVVGRSTPKADWPYAHPGPADGWAGGRQHSFTILFALKSLLPSGTCRLALALVDTQRASPPELAISINGIETRHKLPAGAGDQSIFGQPSKGKPFRLEVPFAAAALKAGANEIRLTTLSGSWLLYDWVGLEAPSGALLADVSGTVVAPVTSAPVLVGKEGALRQTFNVAVRHFGTPTRATVRVNGNEVTNLMLQAVSQRFEVAVPAVAKETRLSVVVEADGATLAEQQVTLKPVRKWVVYLLPHSHVDIGYTHVQTEVERAQWRYLEQAMDIARKTAHNPPGCRFKWNVEVLWAVDSYLRQASPEKQQAFIDAVRAGQVGLEALYGNELTGLCRPEELLRLVGYAQRLAERVQAPIQSAMITDVPGYTWGIVPAFAHSGVKYFSIGPNGGDRIGHTIAAWGDKPFWWIGPNGQDKVLVWMTGTGYYQVFQSPQKLTDYLGQLETKGYPYDMVQVRHCLGDNGAPDVNFADKVKTWNDTHAYPRLVIATADEMFRDFEKRYGDQLPKAQGDFTPYWEDGAASSARETALNRASADRLTQAETVFALTNPKSYPAEEFYQAWRNVILYDEHTWGAHNSISQPDDAFAKSQWAIKQAFAIDAAAQARKLLETALAGRGAEVKTPDVGMNVIDVINTTALGIPWGLVVIPKELSQAGDAVLLSPTNKTSIVTQRLSSGELIFLSCWGPYATHRYYVTGRAEKNPAIPNAATAERLVLRTPDSALSRGLTVRLDETSGAIVSLVAGTRELVDPRALVGLNEYRYLPGSDLKGVRRNGPVRISVKERGPLIASLLVESEAPGCRKLSREIRVHGSRNYVEIIDLVDKQPIRTKEGVHFGFAFGVPGGIMRMDVPWAVVRPETDQIPGACKNWFTVQRWVDISNKDFGVTWLTPDAPLVEVGGITANLIGSLSDPRAWLDHLEPSQTLYSWAMNNHWHTNYRADQEGPTVFRYLIWPHEGDFDADKAARIAQEQSQPFVVTPAREGAPPTARPILSNGNVQVTAFKPSEDGQAIVMRLYGISGKAEQVGLTWSDRASRAVWYSDASEKPLRPLTGAIEVPGHTIVTVRANLP